MTRIATIIELQFDAGQDLTRLSEILSNVPDPGNGGKTLSVENIPAGLRVITVSRDRAQVNSLARKLWNLASRHVSGDGLQGTLERLVLKVMTNGGLKEPRKSFVLTPQSRLREDIGMDSLDLVEFLMEVETFYNIDLPDADGPWVTMQDVSNAVLKHV